MDIEVAGDSGLDLVEKLAELSGTMTAVTFADDLARRNIEGCKQRDRAVAGIVVAASGRLAGPHWQHRLAAVERLDLGFFVHTQNDGMLGRRNIEADDIAHLGHEIRIARKLECLHAMRLQTKGTPDALHSFPAWLASIDRSL